MSSIAAVPSQATLVNHSRKVFPNKFITHTDASCGQPSELVAFRMRLSIRGIDFHPKGMRLIEQKNASSGRGFSTETNSFTKKNVLNRRENRGEFFKDK